MGYLNQTGAPPSGGMSSAGWGAVGNLGSSLIHMVGGVIEGKISAKSNEHIAGGYNQTNLTISCWSNKTAKCICAAHDLTNIKIALIQAEAEKNKKPTSSSSKVLMIFIGATILAATVGVFYVAAKNK